MEEAAYCWVDILYIIMGMGEVLWFFFIYYFFWGEREVSFCLFFCFCFLWVKLIWRVCARVCVCVWGGGGGF